VIEDVSEGGTVADALDLARKQRIETAIFVMAHVSREHLARFVEGAGLSFRHVIIVPNLAGVTTSAVVARDLVGTLGIEIKHNLLNPWTKRFKRMLDVGCVVVGGALIFPLLLVLALLVWLELRGPVLFSSPRLGKDGKIFSCIKFRTMTSDAATMLPHLLEENAELREEYSKYHKLRDDPRVTRMGRFLRTTSLDELPQLWNVLRGEMSLVGPRPYLSHESKDIGPAQREILRVLPGLTGLWQVGGRSTIPFSDRIQLDLYYIRNWSIWSDFLILARTLKIVVMRDRGAY
jgi:Undecaprenyl-phosphate galactose phosphotransferase WbaP